MSETMQQRIVPFHGDELIAIQQPDGNVFVHFGRLCDNLGLARSPLRFCTKGFEPVGVTPSASQGCYNQWC